MMKNLMKNLAIVLLSCLFTIVGVSTASAQTVEFRGTVIITSLNQACIDEGWVLGDIATSRFRPGGVGGNSDTRLSYFFTYFAENYFYDGAYQDLIGVFTDVSGTGVDSRGFHFDAQLRITTVQPGTINADTKYVRMFGRIKDFDGWPGCNINFRGAFNNRTLALQG